MFNPLYGSTCTTSWPILKSRYGPRKNSKLDKLKIDLKSQLSENYFYSDSRPSYVFGLAVIWRGKGVS